MRSESTGTARVRRCGRSGRAVRTLLVWGVLAGFGTAEGWAQTIGDAPPLLNGTTKAKRVLVATGLDSAAGAAVFVCTNMGKTGGKDITLAVQWWSGSSFENDVTAGEGVVVVPPGETVILSTHDTGYFQGENVIPNATGATRGAARILASSSKLVCVAWAVDKSGNPPVFLTAVPLYVKGKQK